MAIDSRIPLSDRQMWPLSRFLLCVAASALLCGVSPTSAAGVQEQTWRKLWDYTDGSDLGFPQAEMRVMHTASLWGDQLVIFGGRNDKQVWLNDLWLFDLAAAAAGDGNPWAQVPTPGSGSSRAWPSPRAYHVAGIVTAPNGNGNDTAAGGDQLLVFGGRYVLGKYDVDSNELWSFHLESSEWNKLSGEDGVTSSTSSSDGDGPGARFSSSGAGWENGLLVMGGINDRNSEDDTDFGDLWYFNLSSSSWVQLDKDSTDTPGKRYQHAGALVVGGGSLGGDAYVVQGGAQLVSQRQYELLSDAWLFDLDTLQWSEITAAPSMPREYHCLVSVGSLAWTTGGVANVVVTNGFQQYYVTSRVLAFNATSASLAAAGAAIDAQKAADAAANQQTDVASTAAAAAAVLGWFEYNPSNSKDLTPRFEHQMVAWRGNIVLYSGRFDQVSDAQDIYMLNVGALADSQLVAAPPDPSVSAQQPIAFLHLVLAMGLIFTFVCLFLSAVRRSMDSRISRSLPIAAYLPGRHGRNGSNRSGGGAEAAEPERGLAVAAIETLPLVAFAGGGGGGSAAAAAAGSEGESCPICLQDYEAGEQLRLLPCQHLFHPLCIGQWLQRHVSCPMCKADVRSPSELPLHPHSNGSTHRSSPAGAVVPSLSSSALSSPRVAEPHRLGRPSSSSGNVNGSRRRSRWAFGAFGFGLGGFGGRAHVRASAAVADGDSDHSADEDAEAPSRGGGRVSGSSSAARSNGGRFIRTADLRNNVRSGSGGGGSGSGSRRARSRSVERRGSGSGGGGRSSRTNASRRANGSGSASEATASSPCHRRGGSDDVGGGARRSSRDALIANADFGVAPAAAAAAAARPPVPAAAAVSARQCEDAVALSG